MTASGCGVCGVDWCLEHCVWCGVDCSPALNLPHAADCPFTTGLFPAAPDMMCAACGDELTGGYVRHETGPEIAEAICLGCAAMVGVL